MTNELRAAAERALDILSDLAHSKSDRTRIRASKGVRLLHAVLYPEQHAEAFGTSPSVALDDALRSLAETIGAKSTTWPAPRDAALAAEQPSDSRFDERGFPRDWRDAVPPRDLPPPPAEQPQPVGHLHSNGDFCQERNVVPDRWPMPLYAAPPAAAPEPSEAMVDAAMQQMRAVSGGNYLRRDEMWAVLDAALAAAAKEKR